MEKPKITQVSGWSKWVDSASFIGSKSSNHISELHQEFCSSHMELKMPVRDPVELSHH